MVFPVLMLCPPAAGAFGDWGDRPAATQRKARTRTVNRAKTMVRARLSCRHTRRGGTRPERITRRVKGPQEESVTPTLSLRAVPNPVKTISEFSYEETLRLYLYGTQLRLSSGPVPLLPLQLRSPAFLPTSAPPSTGETSWAVPAGFAPRARHDLRVDVAAAQIL